MQCKHLKNKGTFEIIDTGVNTGVLDGGNVYGSRHVQQSKEKAKCGLLRAGFDNRVGCTALRVRAHIARLWLCRGHVCNL